MHYILAAIILFLAGGLLSFLCPRQARLSAALGVGGAVAGGVAAAIPAVIVLAGGSVESIHWPWSMPMGSLWLAMDGHDPERALEPLQPSAALLGQVCCISSLP
jgi:hypothetical protein